MVEMVYLNGRIVPGSEARISVYDHSFLYGYGLFETMRAYSGVIFRLGEHLTRLYKSAETIGLDLKGIDLSRACRETVEANGLKSARIRLTVSHGESEAFPWQESTGQPVVVITAREYQPISPDVFQRGYKVGISSCRRSRYSSLNNIKSTNYLVSILARKEAVARGFDEALLLNEDGCITEGSTSNIFFVTGSGLVTPPLDSGILPGITRDTVIEIARELGIDMAQEDVKPADINRFNQAFLTASTMEIMPVASIVAQDGDSVFQSSGTGNIIPLLVKAYREKVAEETGD